MRSFSHTLSRLGRAIGRWLSSLLPQGPGSSLGGNGDGMILMAQVLSWITIAGAESVLTFILVKVLSRKLAVTPPKATVLATTPYLVSEESTTDQLPLEEWLLLARH